MDKQRLQKVLGNPGHAIARWFWVPCSPLVKSSERWLKVYYHLKFARRLDLEHPVTFQEKTQWLKLHDTDPLYTTLVDKYEVRKYVAEKIGEKHLIPLLGVYDRFEDIDFDKLPEQFVLKTTHDSGSAVICKDKKALDINKARKKLSRSLKRNYFYKGREYPYKNVVPRIVAEKFMTDESCHGEQLPDYKFFCFNGKPEMLFVAEGRFSKEGTRFTFFDMDFNEIPIHAKGHEGEGNHDKATKPQCFEMMKELVNKLCFDIPFVRIDVYTINNEIYFGEYTFFHDGGVVEFAPDEWNYKLGEMIKLPTDKQ